MKRIQINGSIVAFLILWSGCASNQSASSPANTDTDVVAPDIDFQTVCNPMDLRYPFREADGNGSRREMADPAAVLFQDDYYLFASKAGGVWHSPDLIDWTFVPSTVLPIADYAPGVAVLDDAVIFTASQDSASTTRRIYSSRDPKSDKWEVVTDTFSISNTDPSFFVDDDGRLYFLWGCSPNDPIYGIELDPDNAYEPIGDPQELLWTFPDEHGWEVSGDDNTLYDSPPWLEGAWLNKIDDRYYLQYAIPGTEFKSYSDGVYVSDSPLGPYTLAPHNPFSYKPAGFACGAGHGSTFGDKYGNLWHLGTVSISVIHMFERRLSLFPVFADADGGLYAVTKYGDYPMMMPDKKITGFDEIFPGWMLLSYQKPVTVSSSLTGYPPENMTDENIRTSWAAETGAEGEWAMLDMGERFDVYALQINFAQVETTITGEQENLKHRYIVEASDDAKAWQTISDQSDNQNDNTHRYHQLKKAIAARYLRISNLEVPDGKFALSGFRVFGKGSGDAPAEVSRLDAVRSTEDRRQVQLEWEAANGAVGYTIGFGTAPDKLYSNYMVYDAATVSINVLDAGRPYYFTIESFNENGITKSAVSAEAL